MGYYPEDYFRKIEYREIIFSYWNKPWFYYPSGIFIYNYIELPSPEYLVTLQISLILSSILGLVSVLPKINAFICFLISIHIVCLHLVLNNTMDGSSTPILLGLFLLCLSNCSNFYNYKCFSKKEFSKNNIEEIMNLHAIGVTIIYFSSGINKIIEVGIDWPYSLQLDNYIGISLKQKVFKESIYIHSLLSKSIISLSSLIGFITLFTELLFPLILFSYTARVFLVFIMISLHIGIFLILGYGYFSNILILLLCLGRYIKK